MIVVDDRLIGESIPPTDSEASGDRYDQFAAYMVRERHVSESSLSGSLKAMIAAANRGGAKAELGPTSKCRVCVPCVPTFFCLFYASKLGLEKTFTVRMRFRLRAETAAKF